MRVFDNIFDKKFLDELSNTLRYTTWSLNNSANRTTWPYGERGTHRLLGNTLFNRKTIDIIEYNYDDLQLSHKAIEMFYAIQAHTKRSLYLEQIATNCQFIGMDATNHTDKIDTNAKEYSFILMLCDDIIDDNQGGEFINETLGETVPFRYGRLIEFETHEVHRGMAFKIPNVARYSLKFVGKEIG